MVRLFAFVSLVASALALSACGLLWDDPAYPPQQEQAQSGDAAVPATVPYIQLAPTAPPAPMMEVKPVIEDMRTTAWRPGHWNYEGGSFSWISGKLIPKPTFTAVWSPDRWEKRGYGWALVPGYWQ